MPTYMSRGGRLFSFTEEEAKYQNATQGAGSFILLTEDDLDKLKMPDKVSVKHDLFYPLWEAFLMHDGYGYIDYQYRTYLKDYGYTLNGDKHAKYCLFHNNLKRLEMVASNYTGKIIVYSMWESTVFPKKYVDDINKYAHAVIVPASWNKEALVSQGVTCPVFICNQGVDRKHFKYIERDDKPKVFAFLHTEKGNGRKGWEYVLEAFKQEFGTDEPVELTLKSYVARNNDPLFIPYLKTQNIVWDDRRLESKEEMAKLYGYHHCLVFPTKGEGWGLVAHEAVMTGLPCIVTKGHAFDDFWNDGFTAVKSTAKDATFARDSFVVNGVDLNSKDKDERYKNVGKWQHADIKDLRKQMRKVYENYSTYKQKAKKGCEYLTQGFNEQTMNKNLSNILDIICT